MVSNESNNKKVKKEKPKEVIKKILPKSASRGSYDLNKITSLPLNDVNNSKNNNKNEASSNYRGLANNDYNKIEAGVNRSNSEIITSFSKIDNKQNKTKTNSNSNKQNKQAKVDQKPKSKAKLDQSFTSIDFPKKRTCLGFPFLCSTYFAAIYSLVTIFSIVLLLFASSIEILILASLRCNFFVIYY